MGTLAKKVFSLFVSFALITTFMPVPSIAFADDITVSDDIMGVAGAGGDIDAPEGGNTSDTGDTGSGGETPPTTESTPVIGPSDGSTVERYRLVFIEDPFPEIHPDDEQFHGTIVSGEKEIVLECGESATFPNVATLPIPVASTDRTGYHFAGWSTSPIADEGKSPDILIVEGQEISFPDEITEVREGTGTVYFYASYMPISYKVRFHANGGNGSMEDETCFYDASWKIPLCTFSGPSGQPLLAWNTKADGSGKWYCRATSKNGVTNVVEVFENMTSEQDAVIDLYAQWGKRSFKIKFSDGTSDPVTGSMGKTTTRQFGIPQKLPANKYKRKGYNFIGWRIFPGTEASPYTPPADLNPPSYVTVGGKPEGRWGNEADISNLTAVNGATVWFQARWVSVDQSFVVHFDGNGADNPFEKPETSEETPDLTDPDAGDGDVEFDEDGNPINPDEEATPDEPAPTMADIAVEYGATGSKLPPNIYTRQGYVFTGWSTSPDGKPVDPNEGFYEDEDTISRLTGPKNQEITLYAQWAPISYFIVYQSGAGADEVSVPAGTQLEYITHWNVQGTYINNPFTRSGYKFIGWESSADPEPGFQEPDIGESAGDENVVPSPDEGNDESSDAEAGDADDAILSKPLHQPGETYMNITDSNEETVVMTARWEQAKYIVHFDANGGDGVMEDMECMFDVPPSLPFNEYTYTGRAFIGWEGPDGTIYEDGADLEEDLAKDGETEVTLKAKWQADEYYVLFKSNVEGTEDIVLPVKFGEEVTLPECTVKNPGYKFTGWIDTDGNIYAPGDKLVDLATDIGEEVIFVANWDTRDFGVEFDGGPQAIGEQAFIPLEHYNEIIVLPECTLSRPGYTFSGWTGKPGTTTVYQPGDVSSDNLGYSEVEDFIAYAVWTPNAYTIRFDANGGTGSMPDISATYDVDIALPACNFEKTGCSFMGWQVEIDGALQLVEDLGTVRNMTTESNGVAIVRAMWSDGIYFIHFDGNGGDGEMPALQMGATEISPLPSNKFNRIGYTFTGWNTLPDGSGDLFRPLCPVTQLGTTTDNGHVTLYAQWKANEYTVSFSSGDRRATGSISDMSAIYDEEIILPSEGYILPGYELVGWITPKGKVVAGSVSNLTAANKMNITLEAAWSPKRYTVAFDGNGATEGEMPPISTEYDRPTQLPKNIYVRNGYGFTGWNTEPDGSGRQFADQESFANLSGSECEDMTLYAQWKSGTYTIEFSPGEGIGSMGAISAEAGIDTVLPACSFIREGYEFAGWQVGDNDDWASKLIDKATVFNLAAPDETVTLTALWRPIVHYVFWTFPNSPDDILSDHGDGTAMGSVKVVTDECLKGSVLEVRDFGAKKTGYSLAGFSTSPKGEIEYRTGDAFHVDNHMESGATSTALYAIWRPNSYTVTFSMGYESSPETEMPAIESINAAYDQDVTLPFAPERDDYSFNGWSIEGDDSGTIYAERAVVRNLSVDDGSEVTVNAVWTPVAGNLESSGNGENGDIGISDEKNENDIVNNVPEAGITDQVGADQQNMMANADDRNGAQSISPSYADSGIEVDDQGESIYDDGDAVYMGAENNSIPSAANEQSTDDMARNGIVAVAAIALVLSAMFFLYRRKTKV